jgi:hypothetical protein
MMWLRSIVEYKMLSVLAVIIITGGVFGILEALHASTETIVIAGGLVGSIASGIVLVCTFFDTDKRESLVTDFLFWRAFSDFGVGIRMAFTSLLDLHYLNTPNPVINVTNPAGVRFSVGLPRVLHHFCTAMGICARSRSSSIVKISIFEFLAMGMELSSLSLDGQFGFCDHCGNGQFCIWLFLRYHCRGY